MHTKFIQDANVKLEKPLLKKLILTHKTRFEFVLPTRRQEKRRQLPEWD